MSEMTQRVRVTVGPRGVLEVEFSGFYGADCLEEERQLRARLELMGLSMRVTRRTMKDAEQIAAETDRSRPAGRVPADHRGRGGGSERPVD